MNKKRIILPLVILSMVMLISSIFVDTIYAYEVGGGGSTGNAYRQEVRCIKTTTKHVVHCACFTGGAPAIDNQCTTSTYEYRRMATLCHFNYVTIEYCTETNPCIE